MKQTGDRSRDGDDSWLVAEDVSSSIDDGEGVGTAQTALLGEKLAQHLDAHGLLVARTLWLCAPVRSSRRDGRRRDGGGVCTNRDKETLVEKPLAGRREDVGHAALAGGQTEVVDDLLHDKAGLGAHGAGRRRHRPTLAKVLAGGEKG